MTLKLLMKRIIWKHQAFEGNSQVRKLFCTTYSRCNDRSLLRKPFLDSPLRIRLYHVYINSDDTCNSCSSLQLTNYFQIIFEIWSLTLTLKRISRYYHSHWTDEETRQRDALSSEAMTKTWESNPAPLAP